MKTSWLLVLLLPMLGCGGPTFIVESSVPDAQTDDGSWLTTDAGFDVHIGVEHDSGGPDADGSFESGQGDEAGHEKPDSGQTDGGTEAGRPDGGHRTVASIVAGGDTTCALYTDHSEPSCWGGDFANTMVNTDVPVPLRNYTNGKTIAGLQDLGIGAGFMCALLTNGTVECWGQGTSGQLGNNNTSSSSDPVQVIASGGSALTGVTKLFVGAYSACAIITSGDVYCWGQGITSANSPTSVATPINQGSFSPFSMALGGNGNFACGIVQQSFTAQVECWGANTNGQLGNGTSTSSYTPVIVKVGSNPIPATSVSAGGSTACAIISGGVDCWGNGGEGEMGDGSNNGSLYPVQASNIANVTDVVLGNMHVCAISQGTVYCWGANSDAELGNGTLSNSSSPLPISDSSSRGVGVTAVALTAGAEHTCALLSDGTVECWGSNYNGQLGNGTTHPVVQGYCTSTPTPCTTTAVRVSLP